MVGIARDDGLEAQRLQELAGILAQMEHDRGAAGDILGRRDAELALALGDPAPALGFAGAPAEDLDPLGDHEGGIEADAELADQGQVLGGVARRFLEEGRGARARDGAEIGDQILAVHADAVVGDGERLGRGVGGDDDPELGILGGQLRPGDRQIAQPVAGVGGVGDQLAQEHRAIAVERMGDDIEQPADLGLEAVAFFLHPATSQSNPRAI